MSNPDDPRVPLNSIVLGYGPMLPVIATALGAWVLPIEWAALATRLAIIWGALILAFLAGVRRGFGFGDPRASTGVEIATMMVYFILAGLALVVPTASMALPLLMIGFALVALLDRRAALTGNAPAHFVRLRVPQMLLGAVGLALIWARLLL